MCSCSFAIVHNLQDLKSQRIYLVLTYSLLSLKKQFTWCSPNPWWRASASGSLSWPSSKSFPGFYCTGKLVNAKFHTLTGCLKTCTLVVLQVNAGCPHMYIMQYRRKRKIKYTYMRAPISKTPAPAQTDPSRDERNKVLNKTPRRPLHWHSDSMGLIRRCLGTC
jgi:hypothetical protein